MKFNQINVDRIRNAYENISSSKWEAGDAALAEIPKGTHGGSRRGAVESVQDYVRSLADAAGVSAESLSTYRDVCSSWPVEERHEGISWTVHRTLMGKENRHEIIEAVLAEVGGDSSKVSDNRVRMSMGMKPNQNGKEAIEKAKEDAAEEARIKAEARHKKELADALSKQKREQDAENARANKAEADRIRKEEQAKAAEATRKQREADAKKIAELEKNLTDEAAKAKFDINTLDEKQKAQIMTLLANDPEQASDWFSAQQIERDRKNREAAERATATAEKRAADETKRKMQEEARRRSKDYSESALSFLANKLMPMAFEFRNLSQSKPINFQNVIDGDFESVEPIYNMAYALEAIAASIREQLDIINAERELSNMND